jgi:hypothetical protein
MHRIHCIALTLLLLLPGSTLQAQNRKRADVPITNVSGVKLRAAPAVNAKVVRELGVGDGVEVVRKAAGDARNEPGELWAFVILVDSRKGDFDSNQKGWVLDKYLGYKNRFKKISSWKRQNITAGFGDYSFTIEIRRDGSFIHTWQPCIDCGEKPECYKGERKVGRSCVSRGHMYRYNNFVWARKPTEHQEYFFIDKRGHLRSVYPEDK